MDAEFTATRTRFPRGCRVRGVIDQKRVGNVIGYGLLPRDIVVVVDEKGEVLTHADLWERTPGHWVPVVVAAGATP